MMELPTSVQPRDFRHLDIDQVSSSSELYLPVSGFNSWEHYPISPRLIAIFQFPIGTRLYREPATKSNRTIILNAIEYVVFPGVVNQDTRNRVLDVIDRYNNMLFGGAIAKH